MSYLEQQLCDFVVAVGAGVVERDQAAVGRGTQIKNIVIHSCVEEQTLLNDHISL